MQFCIVGGEDIKQAGRLAIEEHCSVANKIKVDKGAMCNESSLSGSGGDK